MPRKTKAKTVKYKTGKVLVGSCLDRLKDLPDASVDSIVTDPPYELAFMGKSWDASGIAYSVDLWRECLRVLKPGGHLLAFGGTRTYHRMTVAIEDAGFEIRDSLHWIYGSGFPKNLDVAKAIDKQRHDRDDIYRVTAWIREARDAAGITNKDIDAAFGFSGMAGHWTTNKSQPAVPTIEQIPDLLDVLGLTLADVPDEVRNLLWDLNGKKGQPGPNWAKRPKVGKGKSTLIAQDGRYAVTNGEAEKTWTPKEYDVTAPATDNAKRWAGWGTALKPGHEPVVLARKPLIGTVAANVLTHGTGAINVDGCRIGAGGGCSHTGEKPTKPDKSVNAYGDGLNGSTSRPVEGLGRWPANVILDEEAGAELDTQSGVSKDGTAVQRNGGGQSIWGSPNNTGARPDQGYRGEGGASRFFYCPKPSRAERNAGLDNLPTKTGSVREDGGSVHTDGVAFAKNHHPTVKPVALIRYLVRLITPPGGTILDPFLGSGTTAVAAIAEGFTWIGCELTEDYLPIIAGRVKHAQKQR